MDGKLPSVNFRDLSSRGFSSFAGSGLPEGSMLTFHFEPEAARTVAAQSQLFADLGKSVGNNLFGSYL
jgi:hypothetical protein